MEARHAKDQSGASQSGQAASPAAPSPTPQGPVPQRESLFAAERYSFSGSRRRNADVAHTFDTARILQSTEHSTQALIDSVPWSSVPTSLDSTTMDSLPDQIRSAMQDDSDQGATEQFTLPGDPLPLRSTSADGQPQSIRPMAMPSPTSPSPTPSGSGSPNLLDPNEVPRTDAASPAAPATPPSPAPRIAPRTAPIPPASVPPAASSGPSSGPSRHAAAGPTDASPASPYGPLSPAATASPAAQGSPSTASDDLATPAQPALISTPLEPSSSAGMAPPSRGTRRGAHAAPQAARPQGSDFSPRPVPEALEPKADSSAPSAPSAPSSSARPAIRRPVPPTMEVPRISRRRQAKSQASAGRPTPPLPGTMPQPPRASASSPPLSVRLIPLLGGDPIVIHEPTVVGRDPDNISSYQGAERVALDDPTRSVSKTHAAIFPLLDGIWVTDLHSTNGTRVEGKDGSATQADPDVAMPAMDGSTVFFGRIGFRVEVI